MENLNKNSNQKTAKNLKKHFLHKLTSFSLIAAMFLTLSLSSLAGVTTNIDLSNDTKRGLANTADTIHIGIWQEFSKINILWPDNAFEVGTKPQDTSKFKNAGDEFEIIINAPVKQVCSNNVVMTENINISKSPRYKGKTVIEQLSKQRDEAMKTITFKMKVISVDEKDPHYIAKVDVNYAWHINKPLIIGVKEMALGMNALFYAVQQEIRITSESAISESRLSGESKDLPTPAPTAPTSNTGENGQIGGTPQPTAKPTQSADNNAALNEEMLRRLLEQLFKGFGMKL